MVAEPSWIEENALMLVAIIVGSLGVLFLSLEEMRHKWKKARKDDNLQRLTEPPPALDPHVALKPGEVFVLRSAKSGECWATPAPLTLGSRNLDSGKASVFVDPSVKFQTMIGLGGSFTETSADLLVQLSEGNQKRIMEAYFADTGLRYKVGRIHTTSCDFSTGNWSCVTDTDPELKTFSLDRYKKSMLPMLEWAQKVAGEPLKLMGSPWSPPAWMKDTRRMQHGGKLRADCRAAWANYYVRFARAMEAAGLPLWTLSVQNEPLAQTPWENCLYNAEEERDFVRDYLGPALVESKLDVKLLVWDHNRDEMFARAHAFYSDPEAAKYVWGVAFHWYGDPRYESWPDKAGMVCWKNVQRVHDLRPDTHLVMSEACQEGGPHLGQWFLGERYAESIIKDFNHWTEAWIDWNLILDEHGGPNHVRNMCSAPIIVNVKEDSVMFQSSYYYIGHFSRHMMPGAKRALCTTNRDKLEATAFVNEDDSIVTVVLNQSDSDIEFWLDLAGRAVLTVAPAHSITTFVASGKESG